MLCQVTIRCNYLFKMKIILKLICQQQHTSINKASWCSNEKKKLNILFIRHQYSNNNLTFASYIVKNKKMIKRKKKA